MENVYIAYNFGQFVIYLPKDIKIDKNFRKFWHKQFCTVFSETWCIFNYNYYITIIAWLVDHAYLAVSRLFVQCIFLLLTRIIYRYGGDAYVRLISLIKVHLNIPYCVFSDFYINSMHVNEASFFLKTS